MFRNVFTKSLHDQRRSLVGWGIGLGLVVFLTGAMWPSFRNMPDLERFLESYPEALRELFSVEDITTGAGFLNAELFSMIIPALFIVFGIARGAKLIAGDEGSRRLEPVLSTPVPRFAVLVQTAGATAAATALLGAVLFVVTLATSLAFGMGVPAGHVAIACLAMVLIGIEHGWLALAVGAATGRRSVAIAAGTVAAVGGYLMYVLGALVDTLEPWQPLSPFSQALEHGPVGGTLPLAFAWMVVGGLAAVAVAVRLFDRRDVAAA